LENSSLLGYDAMAIFKWSPTLWMSLLLVSSGLHSQNYSEDTGNNFLWNISNYLPVDSVSYPTRLEPSSTLAWKPQISKWTFMFTIVHSDMFRLAKRLQPSHIHCTIFRVWQTIEVEKNLAVLQRTW